MWCGAGRRSSAIRRRSSGERPSDEIPDVSETAAQGDASLRLIHLDALRKLPAKHRTVVVLRYWEHLSVTETADVLNVSSAAVRTRSTRSFLAPLRMELDYNIGEFAAH